MSVPPRLATALAGLPAAVRPDLPQIQAWEGAVPRELVASWLEALDISMESLMVRLLPLAAAWARAPISGFAVGAVALGLRAPGESAGALYLGANLEIPGQAPAAALHAEQAAVHTAWSHGASGLEAMAVSALPCGACRQFLFELAGAEGLALLTPTPGAADAGAPPSFDRRPLGELLPAAFGPGDLGHRGRLMEPVNHRLRAVAANSADALAAAAVAAANASYAPYTGGACGVALETAGGRIVAGRYAESAAFRPSLSPLAAALSSASHSLPPMADLAITGAAMAEAPAATSQRPAAGEELASLAPGVPLRYLELRLP